MSKNLVYGCGTSLASSQPFVRIRSHRRAGLHGRHTGKPGIGAFEVG